MVDVEQQKGQSKAAHAQKASSIFVSHAHKDVRLAREFLGLIVDGVGIPKDRCFLSSVEETGIPVGCDKHDYLKQCLTSSNVHLALVTPNFLRSSDCNAELGYMWANRRSKKRLFIPFVFKISTAPQDLPWYLQDVKLAVLKEEASLTKLRDELPVRLNAKPTTTTKTWNDVCSKFMQSIDRLVADVPDSIDYASMGRFIDACERFPRVLFFNVQVSFDDWFRPELQTHLALQDATTTRWQLGKLINVGKGANATRALGHKALPDYYGTPTARILFSTHTRTELIKKLRDGSRDVQNFVDLALIHLFMATPLAIVCIDQLLAIMRSRPKKRGDIDFEDRSLYPKVLNLPTQEKLAETDAIALKSLKEKLDEMIMRPGADRHAGIDFALLMKQRTTNGSQPYQVWTGGLSVPQNDMEYCKVTDAKRRPIFYEFGKLVEHAVFRPLTEADVKKTPQLNALLRGEKAAPHPASVRASRLLAMRHPCFRVFHEARKNPRLRFRFARTMKFVWPEYCPLHVMREAEGKWFGVFALSDE